MEILPKVRVLNTPLQVHESYCISRNQEPYINFSPREVGENLASSVLKCLFLESENVWPY